MHRLDWLNARYRVEACDAAQFPMCSRSIDQSAAALELETIGYLRPSKTDAADGFGLAVAQYDLFGMTVALSGDGNTLAIGAPTLNIASTEAVHVFARSGGSWRQVAVLTASNGGLGDRFGSGQRLQLRQLQAAQENVSESLRACAVAPGRESMTYAMTQQLSGRYALALALQREALEQIAEGPTADYARVRVLVQLADARAALERN